MSNISASVVIDVMKMQSFTESLLVLVVRHSTDITAFIDDIGARIHLESSHFFEKPVSITALFVRSPFLGKISRALFFCPFTISLISLNLTRPA